MMVLRMTFAGLSRATLMLAMLLMSAGAIAGEGSAKPYTVECSEGGTECRVDMATYIGWRTYNGNCARCHGAGASGSSLAPNLMQRISTKNMTFKHFEKVVRNGTSGPMGVMPPWEGNGNVMPRLNNLWAYLQARTDGVLMPGRPKKLAQKDEKKADTPSNWE